MPRNSTDEHDLEAALSAAQSLALTRLLAGETVTEAARAAGVDRTTVHRWLREDFSFQASLNRGKREIRQAIQARLLQIAHEAVGTVESAVQDGDVKSALATLKGLGVLSGRCVAIGSEDAETLREEAELSAKQAAQDRLMRRLLAG